MKNKDLFLKYLVLDFDTNIDVIFYYFVILREKYIQYEKKMEYLYNCNNYKLL